MAVAFGGLAVLCLGFGLAPRALIGRLMAPAGAGFLQAGRYAATVLVSPKTLAIPHIAYPFVSAQGLTSTVVTVVVGGLIARWWLRAPESSPFRAPIRLLRGLHTGSVNDYMAFAVTGLVVAMLLLEASRR
jgi:multicomponent Na+:H+ antiporter subunit D